MHSPYKHPVTPDPGMVERIRAQYPQRSNEDKRLAVEAVSQQFPHVSNRMIANICGVSAPFVGTHRPPTRKDNG